MVGVTEKGPLAAVESRTFTKWQANHGGRTSSTQTAFDAAEFLFKEGAKRIVTSRVVGPGAVSASIAVTDAGAATVFTARAKGPGAYGNDLNVVVRTTTQDPLIPAGSYRLRVQTDAAVILEESPDLLDKAAGLFWISNTSAYLTYTDGASANDPAAATYALAGGNDDVAGITDTEWAAAVARFGMDLGTGIVISPGRTTDPAHVNLANHAEAFNRVWYGDAPDSAVEATVIASATGRRSRFGGIFWPWVKVAGQTPGSTRVIPPSVIAAGISARNDAAGLSPNEPAAGDNGYSRTGLDLTQVVTDTTHQNLNNGSINVLRMRFGKVRIMGWRTTVQEASDPKWINLGNARLHRAISNAAWLVGERFLFRQIDGQGLLIAEWGGTLAGEAVMPFFLNNSLYGDTPDEAFRIDLSGNTDQTAQNRQLLADIVLVMSEYGEEITVSIAKQLITEGVGG